MTTVFAPVCVTVLGGCPMRLGPVMLRAERVLLRRTEITEMTVPVPQQWPPYIQV